MYSSTIEWPYIHLPIIFKWTCELKVNFMFTIKRYAYDAKNTVVKLLELTVVEKDCIKTPGKKTFKSSAQSAQHSQINE